MSYRPLEQDWPERAGTIDELEETVTLLPAARAQARAPEPDPGPEAFLAGEPDDIEIAALKTGAALAARAAEDTRKALRWLALTNRTLAEHHAKARAASAELHNEFTNLLANRR
jgi:hypothetical protein